MSSPLEGKVCVITGTGGRMGRAPTLASAREGVGAVGTVMSIAPPERIAESLAGMFVATFVGLSLPVVGAGITLSRHVSPKDTILGFAIAVSAGIAASAIKLVGRMTSGLGEDEQG